VAKGLAKDIKIRADLNTLSKELLKLTVKIALNAQLTKRLGYKFLLTANLLKVMPVMTTHLRS